MSTMRNCENERNSEPGMATADDFLPPMLVDHDGTYHLHTPRPSGYVAHHEWIEKALKTHEPIRCLICNRWAIWLPKKEARKINSQRKEEGMARDRRKKKRLFVYTDNYGRNVCVGGPSVDDAIVGLCNLLRPEIEKAFKGDASEIHAIRFSVDSMTDSEVNALPEAS